MDFVWDYWPVVLDKTLNFVFLWSLGTSGVCLAVPLCSDFLLRGRGVAGSNSTSMWRTVSRPGWFINWCCDPVEMQRNSFPTRNLCQQCKHDTRHGCSVKVSFQRQPALLFRYLYCCNNEASLGAADWRLGVNFLHLCPSLAFLQVKMWGRTLVHVHSPVRQVGFTGAWKRWLSWCLW